MSSGPRTFWLAFGIALIIVVLVGMCLWVPQIWYYSRNSINDDPENVFESLSVSPEPIQLDRLSSVFQAGFFLFIPNDPDPYLSRGYGGRWCLWSS